MPGARAKGSLAYRAMTRVAMAEARAVAVNTAPASMPAAPRMPGFTARM